MDRTVKPKFDWSDCPLVDSDPEVVHGAWVLKGTRVHVQLVLLALADGETVDEFAIKHGLERKELADLLDYIASTFDVEGVIPITRGPRGKTSENIA